MHAYTHVLYMSCHYSRWENLVALYTSADGWTEGHDGKAMKISHVKLFDEKRSLLFFVRLGLLPTRAKARVLSKLQIHLLPSYSLCITFCSNVLS